MHPSNVLRHVARPVAVLPLALLAVACGLGSTYSGEATTTRDAGSDRDAAAGGEGSTASDTAAPADAPPDLDAISGDDTRSGEDTGSAHDTGAASDTGSVADTGALADTGSDGDAATHDGGSDVDAPNALGPAPVFLGTAANYVILAKSTITNAPTSMITGDLGLSPGTSITGLALTRAGTDWTSAQVIGSVFTVANDAPTPTVLGTAVLDMQAAYTDAAGRSNPTFLDLKAGAIGGLTLTPGLYTWDSAVSVPTNVTIAGGPNDEWIFQVTGDLTMAATTSMILSGGAQAKNIVWQVAGSVMLGAASHAEGIVLCQTAITFAADASIEGRLLAQTAVNIAGSIVTAPSP